MVHGFRAEHFRCPCCRAAIVIDRAKVNLDDGVLTLNEVVAIEENPMAAAALLEVEMERDAREQLAAERDRIRDTKEFFDGPEQLPDSPPG